MACRGSTDILATESYSQRSPPRLSMSFCREDGVSHRINSLGRQLVMQATDESQQRKASLSPRRVPVASADISQSRFLSSDRTRVEARRPSRAARPAKCGQQAIRSASYATGNRLPAAPVVECGKDHVP